MSESTSEMHLLHTTDYKSCFDTESYLKCTYSGIYSDPNDAVFFDFFIQNMAQILHDEHKRLGKNKALEFGGGPNLWPSFLLAQYFNSIRFCDYAQCNLDAVLDWIEQKPNAFDWKIFFEKVLDATGQLREKRAEWESYLRLALTRGGLATCDVNDSNCSVLNGQANDYDIIFSSLCLEAACLTIECFNETIKRLVRLLKPGGLILLAMVRNESFYCVDGKKYFCLPLDEAKVEQALHDTGEIFDIHIYSSGTPVIDKEHNKVEDLDGKMVIYAFKIVK